MELDYAEFVTQPHKLVLLVPELLTVLLDTE